MELVAGAIMNIGRNSGRNEKLYMLQRYADVEGFKEILQFVYNPYILTGIAKTKLNKKAPSTGGWVGQPPTFRDVIEYFTNHQTGSDRDVQYAQWFIGQFDMGTDAHTLAVAMVTKNLKIGVTEKTLNKVYGDDFIPMIGIMKGEKYRDFKNKVKGPFIITEKLDGNRRILIKEDGIIKIATRSGIPDEGLVDIEVEAQQLPDNCVYDGELLAIGEFEDSIALRQATMAIANSKGIKHGLTFNVFDMISIEDFKRGISRHNALERKLTIGAMFSDRSIGYLVGDSHVDGYIETFKLPYDFELIKPVPILGIAYTEDDILAITTPIWERGFEGTMLNTIDGKYDLTKDRSRDLLKVKRAETFVLTVIDIEEGTNKNQGKVGALVVDYKGQRVGTGSGLTDAQRIDWWNNPSKIIDKEIEVESFGESTNKNGTVSLNCPIFKRVVGELD